MCGIAAIIGGRSPETESALNRMVKSMQHRGPDGEGSFCTEIGSSRIGIGHTRLSILDLSPSGAQPMASSETGAILSYNGEIYNYLELRTELENSGHSFRGHSDTEVLLAGLDRFGSAYLRRLAGMFALIYLDPKSRRLLVARDPLGIKPLYVARFPSGRIFASEVRAILATGWIGTEIDQRAVASYLAYGAITEPRTIYREILSFPAGCYQEFKIRAGSLEEASPVTRFWEYPSIVGVPSRDPTAEVKDILTNSVSQHLLSDVPVGIFLSSGIDSTVIAGIARELRPDLQTFTVGMSDDVTLSETSEATETSRQFGLKHKNVMISRDEALGSVLRWIKSLDQPSMDGMNVFLISEAVRAQGIKVALSGQGGDELFGGYPSFRDVPRLRRIHKVLHSLPPGFRSCAIRLLTLRRSTSQREKLTDIGMSNGSLRSLYLHRRRTLSNHQMRQLGFAADGMGLDEDFLEPESRPPIREDDYQGGELVSILESHYYLKNMLLRDGDANSMAHSLEVRVPFLDTRMVSLAFSIPESIRFPAGGESKSLLRSGFRDLLRPELLSQKKRGFTLPIARWMNGPLGEQCLEALDTLSASGLVDPSGVQSVWKRFVAEPDSPAWTRAWSLCVLGWFLQKQSGKIGRATDHGPS